MHRTYVALWFLSLTALSGFAAYYWMFTGFSRWDDEGTLLLTVRQFLSGLKLYDQVQGYGPVYYFYCWVVRTVSRTPATHDTVRASSLLPWLLTALICAWIVLRLTRSLLLASIAHICAFVGLYFFRNEPGHPQELCILLLCCLIACGFFAAPPRSRWLAMICMGMLTAALLLIKVNIGVFMMLAVALAVLWHSPRTVFSRFTFIATAAACLILPLVLMKAQLDEPVAERYCLVVVFATISMLLVLLHSPKIECLSRQDFWIALAAFGSMIVAILAILIFGQDISPHSILNSLVLVNLRVSVNQGVWYLPARLSWIWAPWIVAGLGTAAFVVRNGPREPFTERALNYLKLFLGPLSGAGIFFFGQSLLPAITPFCWLILYTPTEELRASQAFPRTFLCSIAIVQTLYAYPIAGSQVGFIQIPLILIAVVCIGDFFEWQRSQHAFTRSPALRGVTGLLLVCVPAFYIVFAGIQRKTYESLAPLGFPGAERIHLPAKQARDYHWLATNLAANCDVFFGMPELPSLHIWLNNMEPSGMIVDDWMLVFTDEQQAGIASELSAHPRACVFYNPQLVGFWNPGHHNMDALPLARYIRRNFKPVGMLDDFSFLAKNDRDISLLPPQ